MRLGVKYTPHSDIIAYTVISHPAPTGPYSLTSHVARLGDNPPAIAIAVLYPIATDVSLDSGGKCSTRKAHNGAPYRQRNSPSTNCAAIAVIGTVPPIPMATIAGGPERASPIAPNVMTRFLPYRSDSHPENGKSSTMVTNRFTALMANAFSYGCSRSSRMHITSQTKVT